jgi:DNA-binding PadR family transcriptional regulator
MATSGLIAETNRRARDRRRVYFRITPLGREVARAEAERLVRLVDLARGKSVLSRSRS